MFNISRAPLMAVLAMAVVAVVAGLATGLASRALHVIGLYEVAAGLGLGLAAVTLCHLWRIRDRRALAILALVAATSWLFAHHVADAWSFRREQAKSIAGQGLLLADNAVLHDTDDPTALTDAALLAETGAAGVRGAAAVLLRRGLTVHRVLGRSRILPVPLWLHALWYALQAALVGIWIWRALGHLANEPICVRCGAWLRRKKLGYLDEAQALELARQWDRGERLLPAGLANAASTAHPLVVMQDACPLGHSRLPGFELRRRRRLSLTGSVPGPLARLAACPDEDDQGGGNGR